MDILIYLAILIIIVLVVWFLLSKINLPEPAGTIIQIAIVVVVAVVVIGFLMQFQGHSFPRLH